MRAITVLHFLNEQAQIELSNRRYSEIEHEISQELVDWLEDISFDGKYLLGHLSNPSRQINNCVASNIINEFDIEMTLNKIHLQDDYPEGLSKYRFIGIYFKICVFLQSFLLRSDLNREIICWYSTDSYNEETEYPSHTVSFALRRSDSPLYSLNGSNFPNVFHIGTLIGVSVDGVLPTDF